MENFLLRLQNFAFASKRYGDIYIAVIIVSVIGLMIMPVPPFLLTQGTFLWLLVRGPWPTQWCPRCAQQGS